MLFAEKIHTMWELSVVTKRWKDFFDYGKMSMSSKCFLNIISNCEKDTCRGKFLPTFPPSFHSSLLPVNNRTVYIYLHQSFFPITFFLSPFRWVWNVWRGVVKEKYLEKLKDNRWEKIQHRITIKGFVFILFMDFTRIVQKTRVFHAV